MAELVSLPTPTLTKAPDAAKSLIQFLTGPTAAPVFKSKGFEPG
jgi:ABC-type molybdate transport system substrate-binding protein